MKRRALQIFVLLLLGAIVNVAVAWGCMVSSLSSRGGQLSRLDWGEAHLLHVLLSQCGMRPEFNDPTVRFFASGERVVHPRSTWERLNLDFVFVDSPGVGRDAETLNKDERYLKFLERVGSERQTTGEEYFTEAERSSCGWPVRSLSGERWRHFTGNARTHRKLDLRMPELTQSSKQAIVAAHTRLQTPTPLWEYHHAFAAPSVRGLNLPAGTWVVWNPIWPGFAINTIFYAAVLWMVFALPFVLRRRRRIKRGLCPACAYPVGASPVCTECGKPLHVPRAATSVRGWPMDRARMRV